MGFFDSLFTSSGNSDPTNSSPNFGDLNKNVFFPSNFMGRPRLARGLDNALLSLATMQNSPTAGQNISNVARNVMDLDSARQSDNLNTRLAPYLSMEPLVKMQGEMAQQNYLAKEGNRADAQAAYYEAGGRQMRPEPYVDGKGLAWTLTPKGPIPMLGPDGKQLTGHTPGSSSGSEIMQLIHGEEAEDFQKTGQPWAATQRSNRWAQLAGVRAGDQTTGRINATPGYLSDTTKEQLKTDLAPVDTELDRLNKLGGVDRIRENALNPSNTIEQRISDLTTKRNQILNRYIPQGYGNGAGASPSSFGGPVDIPQPISPVATDQPGIPANGGGMRPGNVGGIPIGIGPGISDAQLNAAIVPPGPKPAKPAPVAAKPSPAKAARPRITIDSKGNVSVN